MSSIWSRSDRQELEDSGKFSQLSENEKRLAIRNELAAHNKHLASAAKDAGVKTPLDYAIFQDHGYRGLYGGLAASERRKQKKSYVAIACDASGRRIKRISQSVKKCGKPSKTWVAPCPKLCPRRSRASCKSRGQEKFTENLNRRSNPHLSPCSCNISGMSR